MFDSCSRCGKPISGSAVICPHCGAKANASESENPRRDSEPIAAELDRVRQQVEQIENQRETAAREFSQRLADWENERASLAQPTPTLGRERVCLGLGLFLTAVGLYFLVIDPSHGRVEGLDTAFTVVNLQRLYIGQTFTIVGTMFVAVAIRPR